METTLFVGTLKGAFLYRSDARRERWSVEGPLFPGWKVTALGRDLDGGWLAATASSVYGAAIHRSDDLREWRQVELGPRYAEESGWRLRQVWTFARAGSTLYAGVDDAGLFASTDGGDSWELVEGLTAHDTRAAWFPGFGGLCAHHVVSDPSDASRLWCGISAVGVFQSEDGGATWSVRNEGVTRVIEDEVHADIGACVHAIVADPDDPERIWRQDHRGMYRTANGGATWESIQEGLPSTFGFPLVMHAPTKALFCCPLESDEFRFPVDGALRVYRSTDAGDSWQSCGEGLPGAFAYTAVLRSAMATDGDDPGGVYLGTTGGAVYASRDLGERWTRLEGSLPRVLTVETCVE